jgi:hypothetical protein
MEKQLSEKLPRVEVVDALRGFAVMAILLVHSLEHFIFPVYPVDQPAWLNILNDGVFNVTFTLFTNRKFRCAPTTPPFVCPPQKSISRFCTKLLKKQDTVC